MQKLTQKDAILLLNITAQSIALIETLDKLKHTTFYRQQIKKDANNLSKQLFEIAKQNSNLFEVDDDAMMDLVGNCKDLVSHAMNFRPEQWQIIPYVFKWVNEPKSIRFAQVKALCIQDDAEKINKTKP